VPRSRSRRKQPDYSPTAPVKPTRKAGPAAPSRWVAPVMIALLIVGLLWIVVWYVAGTTLPVMSTLGVWNLVIGFGLVLSGLLVATRWR
jgi:hypothetical protein